MKCDKGETLKGRREKMKRAKKCREGEKERNVERERGRIEERGLGGLKLGVQLVREIHFKM